MKPSELFSQSSLRDGRLFRGASYPALKGRAKVSRRYASIIPDGCAALRASRTFSANPSALILRYLLTTSTTNEPGLMLRWGRPPAVAGGISLYSAAVKNTFFVLVSKAIVLALGWVLTAPASS